MTALSVEDPVDPTDPRLDPEHATATGAAPAGRAAVVTGASSGIGRATALRLARTGWQVLAVARRTDRLEGLAVEAADLPGTVTVVPADLTTEEGVAAVLAAAEAVGGVDTLVNIAGGARGVDAVAEARTEDWEWMFQANVMATLRLTRAFLPMLRAHGEGTVLVLSSTAGLVAYEGGAGYNAAKFAEHGMVGALRLEEAEHNVRVVEVLPGMVRTEEFSLQRLGGDQAAADAVYAGVEKPLTAEDVADVCAYALEVPHHVNLDQIVLRPVAQAAQHKVIRR
ncbi:SDR family oxidoreductase [Micrococcus sp.]|uniref:SDR family oxidoreductase n=1 Tax=Micrococcus sp. TaxID=1271 RepID=UPI002A911B11|nr:SDR family oxidoreductase [Micrococcus sp.]MDY6055128.1 SDR family oxidoreductase [Micrococcus sp.]